MPQVNTNEYQARVSILHAVRQKYPGVWDSCYARVEESLGAERAAAWRLNVLERAAASIGYDEGRAFECADGVVADAEERVRALAD